MRGGGSGWWVVAFGRRKDDDGGGVERSGEKGVRRGINPCGEFVVVVVMEEECLGENQSGWLSLSCLAVTSPNLRFELILAHADDHQPPGER